MIDTQPGLRDRHKARTRRRVRAAAIELFTERGYDQVTVDDVAAACEVSRATIFRYFPTKDDLVVGDEVALFAALRDDFDRQPPTESPFDALRGALHEWAVRFQEEADHEQLLRTRRLVTGHGALLARALELRAGWAATFAGLMAERAGRSAPELRDRVLAATVMTASHVATSEWLDTGGTQDLPVLLDHAVGMLAEGFAGR